MRCRNRTPDGLAVHRRREAYCGPGGCRREGPGATCAVAVRAPLGGAPRPAGRPEGSSVTLQLRVMRPVRSVTVAP